jgi:hypothetical protein
MLVVMCKGVLSVKPPVVRSEKIQCHIFVGNTDLLISLSGTGHIQQVRIQGPDGKLVATYPGCGGDECNYSMLRFEHAMYHVIVISSVGTFQGDINW